MTTAITSAIEHVGGPSALAAEISRIEGRDPPLNPSLVSQWATGRRPVAAHHCLAIEQATDRSITRYQLRPDVFGAMPECGGTQAT